MHIYNIDDYHDIHEKRRPDTVSTSMAKHFSTCVAKPVVECFSVPITFNGVSIHNPNNIEASRICWYLLNKYTGTFDITYTERRSFWISQGYQAQVEQCQIEDQSEGIWRPRFLLIGPLFFLFFSIGISQLKSKNGARRVH